MNTPSFKLLNFISLIGSLKTTRRFKTLDNIDGDSVADHTWRLAMFVFLVADEFKLNINTLKAVKMALVHDLVEIITDDIDAVEQYRKNLYSKKALDEAEAIKEVVKSLSDEQASDIHSIWTEFDEAKTPEAKFVFALDKIEGVFTLLESGHKAFTLPHLVASYGNEQVADFPELKPLFIELKLRLKEEFKKGGIEWKDEYEI